MATKDWFRNRKWNEEIENSFFAKLKRARSNRDQYLAIQALTLAKSRPEVTLKLVDYYFKNRKDKLDDMRALWAKSEALLALGKTKEAMTAYRSVLAREDEFPYHISDTYVRYPYIVATKLIENEYENAVSVLKKNESRLAFPLDYFMWHSSLALIEGDANHASSALEAAKVKKSGFSFHQNVGLVGKEHAETIKNLLKIST